MHFEMTLMKVMSVLTEFDVDVALLLFPAGIAPRPSTLVQPVGRYVVGVPVWSTVLWVRSDSGYGRC